MNKYKFLSRDGDVIEIKGNYLIQNDKMKTYEVYMYDGDENKVLNSSLSSYTYAIIEIEYNIDG